MKTKSQNTKPKKRFVVVMKTSHTYEMGDGVDSVETRTEFTYAVSKPQAISNVKRRYGIRPGDLVCHSSSGYCRRITFDAKPEAEAEVV